MPTNPATRFLNRELSWLEFNQRVLDEALNPLTPLFERVKFFCITSTNLDEFFEVRVAGIKQQIESHTAERSNDGLSPIETFRAVQKRVERLVQAQYACWRDALQPALAANGIRFLKAISLNHDDRIWLDEYYRKHVRPVLTPLAIDPAHPFPQLLNKSLNAIVHLTIERAGQLIRQMAVVPIPRVLPRLVFLPRSDARKDCLLLEEVVGHYLADLFPGTNIIGLWLFRVTRNSELYIHEEDIGNLLKAVENELHNRRKGAAVRLELSIGCPPEIRQALLGTLNLEEEDLYQIDGPLSPGRLMSLGDGVHLPELRDPPYVAPVAAALRNETDLFAAIRRRDILLHHPYESFGTVIDLLEQASQDPKVLAIKQTLYRTGGDQRIIGSLMNAVRNGKQVTAVVELRARFDEANNIEWARRLEEAGVHVVYGLVGYKIHCKVCLIVRHDEDEIRRYVHFGTGNYNPVTAKTYTDLGLLTCRPEFGEDATNLFNLLTGIRQFQGTQRIIVAPFDLHRIIIEKIRREATNAERGLPARIVAKTNALVDAQIIEELYAASAAGVRIQLIVRGICCLRPQVKGLSENITVVSIVDRFLEHGRVFYFENACQPEVFLGSADWMQRNFFKRIEVVIPVADGNLCERIKTEILETALNDNVKARLLGPDGNYELQKPSRGKVPCRSQEQFMAFALRETEISPIKPASKHAYPRMKLTPRPAR